MFYRIYENGEFVNDIVADEAFVTTYCAENGYTYEAIVYEQSAEPDAPAEGDIESRIAAVETDLAGLTAAVEKGLNL